MARRRFERRADSPSHCFFGKAVRKAERLGRRLPSRAVELSFGRSPGCIVENMRVASVRAARRELVKLFRKPNSKFYWYDFTVRGRRYRGSTQETKSARAAKAASLKLASVIEGTDPLPSLVSFLSLLNDLTPGLRMAG